MLFLARTPLEQTFQVCRNKVNFLLPTKVCNPTKFVSNDGWATCYYFVELKLISYNLYIKIGWKWIKLNKYLKYTQSSTQLSWLQLN